MFKKKKAKEYFKFCYTFKFKCSKWKCLCSDTLCRFCRFKLAIKTKPSGRRCKTRKVLTQQKFSINDNKFKDLLALSVFLKQVNWELLSKGKLYNLQNKYYANNIVTYL